MILDSRQADIFYGLCSRVIMENAPDADLAERAGGYFDKDGGWRFVSRLLAEISPSILRQGDHARWHKLCKAAVPLFYYELQAPLERFEHKENEVFYTTFS